MRLRLTSGARWATTVAPGAGVAAAAGWAGWSRADVTFHPPVTPRGLKHIFFFFFLPPFRIINIWHNPI